MRTLTTLYILNASLLLLHEIESAYVKEWEILHLPGKITGFLLMHVPILLFLFWGAIEVDRQTTTGYIVAAIAGLGGILPFLVHKVLVKKDGYFESPFSNLIIYSNVFVGACVLAMVLIRYNP